MWICGLDSARYNCSNQFKFPRSYFLLLELLTLFLSLSVWRPYLVLRILNVFYKCIFCQKKWGIWRAKRFQFWKDWKALPPSTSQENTNGLSPRNGKYEQDVQNSAHCRFVFSRQEKFWRSRLPRDCVNSSACNQMRRVPEAEGKGNVAKTNKFVGKANHSSDFFRNWSNA